MGSQGSLSQATSPQRGTSFIPTLRSAALIDAQFDLIVNPCWELESVEVRDCLASHQVNVDRPLDDDGVVTLAFTTFQFFLQIAAGVVAAKLEFDAVKMQPSRRQLICGRPVIGQ